MKKILPTMTILLLINCYLNPVFQDIVFPEEEEDNFGIFVLVAEGIASRNATNSSEGSDLPEDNSDGSNPPEGVSDEDDPSVPPSPGEPISPTISFSPNSYTFKRSFAIPAIRPVVEGIPFSDCVSSEPLVNGLLLNENNCRITGTPTSFTGGSINYTITATNSVGNSSGTVFIEVVPATGLDTESGFTVTVSGLETGESFIFDDILGNEFLVSTIGEVSYNHPHLVGSSFQFTILENPTSKVCIIENSSGTVSVSNPTIHISCE